MKYLLMIALSTTSFWLIHAWGDEDYRYDWPSTRLIRQKDGRSYKNEKSYTYSYMPDTRYLGSFVDPDIDYPSQRTGKAYN